MARQPYQDVWRGGRVVQQGRRECAERYAVILRELERECGVGLSVADIGGWDGYFPIRLREDLAAVATNVDMRAINLAGTGVTHLQMHVDARSVQQLGHYDAILALSVLHHMDDWPRVLLALRERCRVLIVETPHPDELADASHAPVIAATAHRIAPLYEAVMGAGEVIGEAAAISSPGVRRPIVAIRREHTFGILGTVEPGRGKASASMAGWSPEVWEPLRFHPVPGTLNVRVGPDGVAWVRDQQQQGVRLEVDDSHKWHLPVVVSAHGREHIGAVKATRSRVTVEVLAPVSLRDELSLQDGDVVSIRRAL